jgi:NitT/TauT family transport system ATP-binding protein/nitrate/nitrite transport system substrate-binding protein
MPDETEPARLGALRLTDAAPVFLADARGLFAAEGVPAQLSVEPSWANVADKLAFGLLDAAVMLPPLALAMALGLRGPGTPLVVPMGLSANGSSIVLGRDLAEPVLEGGQPPSPLEAGRRLGLLLRSWPRRPRLAVVHAFSTHDLLLRHWLAASGIDPERAIEFVVVPPAETAEALARGRIDGFCAGAPWGAVAARAGLARTVALSSAIWPGHPEKCLVVRADWAARHPVRLQGLLRALLRAGLACDDPADAGAVAALLAERSRVGVPAGLIAPSLAGGEPSPDVDRSLFAAHGVTFPQRAHARWLAGEMARWRELPADAAAVAERLYQPSLHAEAAQAVGLPLP